ncbi:MAG: dihydroorotase [bacterium]|nr:dihydroorotase [bacterium]
MDAITIRRPDDFHVHFRRGEILKSVVPFTARQFGRAMAMPNTSPEPILTRGDALKYWLEITEIVQKVGLSPEDFCPLVTIQITDETEPNTVREIKEEGMGGHKVIVAGKVYPLGVTTNSHNGVSDFRALYRVFAAMEEVGLVLSLHGQVPKAFCLDREKEFLDTLAMLAKDFPALRIVMEHISTKESVDALKDLPKTVGATITLHHLLITLHDVLSFVGEEGSEGLNPHHYCQPIPQKLEDRGALIGAAMSGNPKFFFGSDSAPHLKERKESSCGCAGVFSAPVLLPLLVGLFEFHGKLDRLEPFVSEFGARFYGLPLNQETITLNREEWVVPKEYNGIVPFFAGKTVGLKVQG